MLLPTIWMAVCLELHRELRLIDRVGMDERNHRLSVGLDSFDHRARPENRVFVRSNLGRFISCSPLGRHEPGRTRDSSPSHTFTGSIDHHTVHRWRISFTPKVRSPLKGIDAVRDTDIPVALANPPLPQLLVVLIGVLAISVEKLPGSMVTHPHGFICISHSYSQ